MDSVCACGRPRVLVTVNASIMQECAGSAAYVLVCGAVAAHSIPHGNIAGCMTRPVTQVSLCSWSKKRLQQVSCPPLN